MSKYAPLADHLSRLTEDEIRLDFSDIEAVIGASLPASAGEHPAWWANSRTEDSHSWAHLWLRAGWERRELNLAEGWVVFRRVQYFDIDSPTAREGYEIDRRVLGTGRNAALADRRKRMDDYTCQACAFRLEIEGRYVIEVHHLDPLSVTGEQMTSIEQVVSLCPTCHRVAHLRSTPYSIADIRGLRQIGQSPPDEQLGDGENTSESRSPAALSP